MIAIAHAAAPTAFSTELTTSGSKSPSWAYSAVRIPTVADDNSIRTRPAWRPGGRTLCQSAAVRRSLTDPLQSSVTFGVVFRCGCSDYHRLTAHTIKRRQIPFPQVGRSHNPLVRGSSPTPHVSDARRILQPPPHAQDA